TSIRIAVFRAAPPRYRRKAARRSARVAPPPGPEPRSEPGTYAPRRYHPLLSSHAVSPDCCNALRVRFLELGRTGADPRGGGLAGTGADARGGGLGRPGAGPRGGG